MRRYKWVRVRDRVKVRDRVRVRDRDRVRVRVRDRVRIRVRVRSIRCHGWGACVATWLVHVLGWWIGV